MTTAVKRTDLAVYERLTRMDDAELVAGIRDLLGAKLTAYLGEVTETRTVRQWAEGERAIRSSVARERLRVAFRAASLVAENETVFVNAGSTAQLAFGLLAKGGVMVQVGLFGGEFTISTSAGFSRSSSAAHVPCSTDEAWVSDIYTDTFTGLQTITMYFPFVFYDPVIADYRHGLTGIDIAVDEAFKDVLRPFESLNPTRTVLSFEEVEPCRPFHLCLSTPLMRTQAGNDLYLKWSYSYGDFIRSVLYGAAFKLYLIILLLIMLTGRSLVTRLRTLAQTDHLTRLPRRDILNEALLQEHDYLMILDIDNFKSVNDTHGHGVGDLALVAFAAHLKANIRRGDVAIRWGGEEFIVLFKGMDDDNMMHHSAARLLERPLRIPELPAPITFSAGVTRIRDYLTVAEAVQLADDLLYHVKQHGKRNIAYYQGQTILLVRDPGAD